MPPGNPQRLVGVLVAHGGSVTIDQLSEAIWPGEELETSRSRLRNVLLRLRRAVGDVVVRTGSGLRLGPGLACDLHEFERQAVDALAAARADPELAGQLAAEAVALGDAPLFVDFEYDEWAVPARRGAEQQLISLLDLLSVQAEDAGDLPGRPGARRAGAAPRPLHRLALRPPGRAAHAAEPRRRGDRRPRRRRRGRQGHGRRLPGRDEAPSRRTAPPDGDGGVRSAPAGASRQRIRGPSARATDAVWAKHGDGGQAGRPGPSSTMMRDERVFMPSHDGNVPSNARPTLVDGRHLTPLLLPPLHRLTMTLISEPSTVGTLAESQPWERALAPTRVADDRRRETGPSSPCAGVRSSPWDALVERDRLDSPRLVSAVDLGGRAWWIPAAAVWSDADGDAQPQHPRAIGLAAGRSREVAVLAGLSDRLGLGGQRRPGSAAASCPSWTASASTTGTARSSTTAASVTTSRPWSWSGTPWPCGAPGRRSPRRYHRALFGDHGHRRPRPVSWTMLRRLLDRRGLDVVAVDLGTPADRAGRCGALSVQLAGLVSRAGTVVGRRPGRTDPCGGGGEWPAEPPVASVKLSARPSHCVTERVRSRPSAATAACQGRRAHESSWARRLLDRSKLARSTCLAALAPPAFGRRST